MNVEFINPFLSSTISVFSTMLDTKLKRGEPYLKTANQSDYEISGLIGLSGKAKGMVVLSMTRDAAINAASIMLGETLTELNADVADAVGELTNMVAGAAKAKIDEFKMSVSLPTVISGKAHCIEFPKNTMPIVIPFESKWGPIAVEVGIVET
jgi:chemotaxis protein CheX